MKKLTIIVLLVLAAPYAHAQASDTLPQIGVRQTAILSPSYSCRSAAEFYERGYDGPALFLSDAMQRRNSPDLVFNGACGSKNYFQSVTHGVNFSLVADLGTGVVASELLTLTELDARRDYRTLWNKGFRRYVPVVPGHTYAVLLDKHGIRGLFVFTVTDHVKDRRVEVSYEVLDYRVTGEESNARGSARRRRL